MFRLVCFIEDKNLPSILHACQNKMSIESLQPVQNAIMKRGKVRAAHPNGGTVTGRITEMVKNHPSSELTRAEFKELIIAAGGKIPSISTLVTTLMKRNLLKSTKKNGIYSIVR